VEQGTNRKIESLAHSAKKGRASGGWGGSLCFHSHRDTLSYPLHRIRCHMRFASASQDPCTRIEALQDQCTRIEACCKRVNCILVKCILVKCINPLCHTLMSILLNTGARGRLDCDTNGARGPQHDCDTHGAYVPIDGDVEEEEGVHHGPQDEQPETRLPPPRAASYVQGDSTAVYTAQPIH
jgi:hypothetical protein